MADELTNNSGRTAISRNKISAPLKYIIGIYPKLSKVFHQGPGLKDNPDREKLKEIAYGEVVEYDPGHGPTDRDVLRQGDCDEAISIYVLNVLPPKTRRKAILDLYYTIKPGGTAYIAVRSLSDINKNKKETWEQIDDGYMVSRGKSKNFQRGFTRETLKEELVEEFTNIEAFDEGGFIIAVAKRRSKSD